MRKLALVSLIAIHCAATASAAFVANLYEDGPDVVLTVTGSTTVARTTTGTLGGVADEIRVRPSVGFMLLIGNSNLIDEFALDGGVSFPSFGAGNSVISGVLTSDSNTTLFATSGANLYLLRDYVSGTTINASGRFQNKTLADLGAQFGSYSATFGGGADSISLYVIPEPHTLAVIGAFGGGLLVVRRRLREKAGSRTSTTRRRGNAAAMFPL